MLLLGDLFSTDFIENASSQSIYLSAMQQTLHTVSFPQFSRISQFNSNKDTSFMSQIKTLPILDIKSFNTFENGFMMEGLFFDWAASYDIFLIVF